MSECKSKKDIVFELVLPPNKEKESKWKEVSNKLCNQGT